MNAKATSSPQTPLPISKRLQRALYLLVLGVLVWLVFRHRHELIPLLREHLWAMLYAALLMVAGLLFQSLNFLQLLGAGKGIPLVGTFRTWALANLVNYIAPFQPGLAVRALFFKRYRIAVSTTARVTLQQLHLSLWMATAVVAAGGLLVGTRPLVILALGSALVFLVWPYLLSLARKITPVLFRFAWVQRQGVAIDSVLTTPPVRRLGLFALQYLIGALLLYGVYRAFGAHTGWGECLLLTAMVYLLSLIAVLPNNLGLLEVLYGYAGHLGGLGPDEAIAVALLLRVAHILACSTVVMLVPGMEGNRKAIG